MTAQLETAKFFEQLEHSCSEELVGRYSVVKFMARPNADEFEVSDGGVLHTPTGHRLVGVPGGSGKTHFEPGHETRVLEYDREAVRRMALRLWAKHGLNAKQQLLPD